MTLSDDAVVDDLEQRAAVILSLLEHRESDRPLIIEFSGTPKAGKTTAIGVLSLFLRRNKIDTTHLIERASVSPIRVKGHLFNNTWVTCASLLGLLESLYKPDSHIFILDRGIFDGLVWNTWLLTTGKINEGEARQFAEFFSMPRWSNLIDLVCVMHCEPSTSLEREYAGQLTRKGGRIMDETVLRQLNEATEATIHRYGHLFKKIVRVDTTALPTRQGVINLTRATLQALNSFLDPNLCVVPKSQVPFVLPDEGFVHDPVLARHFIDLVHARRQFVKRSDGENDQNVYIPIPCAIIAFENSILFLKRKEHGHPLHDTYAIWAGGHISELDNEGTSLVETALRRELEEEVFIKDKYTLYPVGLVRTSDDERASRHIGIVFMAKLTTADVSLALDQKEFRETRGLSMSGRLVDTARVHEFYADMGNWSRYLVDRFWPSQIQRDLFRDGEMPRKPTD